MKKYNKLLLLIILTLIFFTTNISSLKAASITGIINDREGVNVRSGAGTNYDVVGYLSYASNAS